MNREEIEDKLKKEVGDFVDLHEWHNSENTTALYTGFHMVNDSMVIIDSQEQTIKELREEIESLKIYKSRCLEADRQADRIIEIRNRQSD